MNKYIGTFGRGMKYNNKDVTGKAVEFEANSTEEAKGIMSKHFGKNYAELYFKEEWEYYFEGNEDLKETVYPLNKFLNKYK